MMSRELFGGRRGGAEQTVRKETRVRRGSVKIGKKNVGLMVKTSE